MSDSRLASKARVVARVTPGDQGWVQGCTPVQSASRIKTDYRALPECDRLRVYVESGSQLIRAIEGCSLGHNHHLWNLLHMPIRVRVRVMVRIRVRIRVRVRLQGGKTQTYA